MKISITVLLPLVFLCLGTSSSFADDRDVTKEIEHEKTKILQKETQVQRGVQKTGYGDLGAETALSGCVQELGFLNQLEMSGETSYFKIKARYFELVREAGQLETGAVSSSCFKTPACVEKEKKDEAIFDERDGLQDILVSDLKARGAIGIE